MRRVIGISTILLLAIAAAIPAAAADRNSVVIVFKDGHHQTFAMTEIASIDFTAPAVIVYKDGHREKISADIDRIEFGAPDNAMLPGRAHFIGKWEVGDGNNSTFFMILEADGNAKKTRGEEHGTWTLVDGEAHIAWDDGWHDAIRKVGTKYEKVAHEPGKSFDDPPSNVTAAKNTDPKPI
jgi:hypothetical protein